MRTLPAWLSVAPLATIVVACSASVGASAGARPDGTTTPSTPDGAIHARPAELLAEAEAIHPVDPGSPALPVTVTTASGDEVTITDVSRIVPLNGSLAEIVWSLGLGDNVVARDATATFTEAADLPLISTGHEVSAEGVLSLRPSVVLGDTRSGPPEVLDQLRAAGVPVVIFEEAWSLDEVAPRIDAVAAALGVPAAGTALVDRTEQQVAAAAAASTLDATVAFLYVRGGAGVFLLGGDGSGADSLVEALGATDVGTSLGLGPFTPLTAEALVSAAPDVLLVMRDGLESVGGLDGLLELPGVAQTPAGRARRVVAVDDGLLLNFGPRTGATLRYLAALFTEVGSS